MHRLTRLLAAGFLIATFVVISSEHAFAASCSTANVGPITATIVGSGTIHGTPGSDVILGSSGRDVIDGRGGNDIVCAMGGNDDITLGGGGDFVDGGSGNDTIRG